MRERFLFVLVGLLAGLLVGFVFAASISQKSPSPVPEMPAAVGTALDNARRQPDNFEAQVKAAELYFQIQRYDEALAYLMRANQIQPDDFETIANLGTANLDGGHLEEAQKWFERALKRQPNNTTVLDGYCSVLLRLGNAEAPAYAILRLEKLDPSNPDLSDLRSQLKNLKSNR